MHFLSADREFARHPYCAETAQYGASYPALQGDADCDAAVVGSGLAGLSATIALADMPNWINSACCQAAVHDPRSGHLHPLKYAPGLARATAGLGLPLPKHTAASAITPAASPTVTAGARPTSAAWRTRRKSII